MSRVERHATNRQSMMLLTKLIAFSLRCTYSWLLSSFESFLTQNGFGYYHQSLCLVPVVGEIPQDKRIVRIRSLRCCVWKNQSILYKWLWRSLGRGCWRCNRNRSWRTRLWPVSTTGNFSSCYRLISSTLITELRNLGGICWVLMAVVFASDLVENLISQLQELLLLIHFSRRYLLKLWLILKS